METAFYQHLRLAIADTDKIRRVRWTPEKLREAYARRSINEILQDRTVHYANPCIELTPILQYHLQERGYESDLYVEVNNNKLWNPTGVIGLHLGLKLNGQEELHHLHLKTHNQVALGKGPLPRDERPEVTRIALYLIPGRADPNKSLIEQHRALLRRLPISLEEEVERLIKDDHDPKEYQRYQERLQGRQHLYLDERHPQPINTSDE